MDPLTAPRQDPPPAGETSPGRSGPEPLQESAGDPDREWVERAVAGENEAFDELVRRHQNRVYTRIYFMVRDRELALDLAQEAFLKAYQNLASFRGEALFATWLGRIAVNVTLHHFERTRAKKRSGKVISIQAPRDDGGHDLEIEDNRNNPFERVLDRERHDAILAAVAELDEEYRVALALRELHGLSYQEISEGLGIPLGTVKSRIFRARQQLEEKLRDIL